MGRTIPLLSLLFVAASRAGAQEVTLKSLLGEITDLEKLTRFPPSPPYATRQSSSYDRASKSPSDPSTWFANGDSGHYLRVEQTANGRKEHVMLDAAGPGTVVRIWSANPDGTLRIYIDGAQKPALEAPMGDLLRGKVKPFVPPLGHEVSRGCNLYFPFPYGKQCKITSDKGGFYYQVNYRTYPEDTRVEPYSPEKLPGLQAQIDRALEILKDPENAYEASPKQRRTEIHLAIGGNRSFDIKAMPGGEVIRKLVLRSSTSDPEALRSTVFVAMFDGGQPTVSAPIGDFFGTGPGLNVYSSLPLSVSKDGTLTCRWPMPFWKAAVFMLGEGGAKKAEVTGYALSEPYIWTDDSLHFHAKWHAGHEMKTEPPRDWNYVTLEGQGIYAGNSLNVANPSRAWWGEGDEKIYVDGEPFPSHFGTGTEDYYGYAWSSPELFTHAFHNQTRCDGPGTFGYTSVNRWHIFDNIPFSKSFRFDMEVWHWDRKIKVSYDTVNFWYARPLSKDNVPDWKPEVLRIPVLPERRVLAVKDAIEGEKMKVVEKTDGVADSQDMTAFEGDWSRDAHLWWRGAKPGDRLVLSFEAPKAGRYRITAQLTKAVDYGIHQLSINGQAAGKPIDLFHDGVIPADPLDLGVFDLKEKDNQLTVEVAGTNEKARPKAYMFGLDYLVLKPQS